jgi:hypothetical protein
MGDNAQYKQEFAHQTNGETTPAGKAGNAQNSLTDSQTGTEVGPSVLPEPKLSPDQGYIGAKSENATGTSNSENFNYDVADNDTTDQAGFSGAEGENANGPISKLVDLD